MKSLHAVALFFAALLPAIPLACSNNPTAASACTDYARAACELGARCDSVSFHALYGDDINACINAGTPSCNAATSVKGTGATPSYIEGCANAIVGMSCFQKLPSACAAPSGTLGDGVSCSESSQCKGGTCLGVGIPSSSDGGLTCGTCTEKAPTSAPSGCAVDTDCPGDQVCLWEPYNGSTPQTQCVGPLAKGATCSDQASSTPAVPCQAGLFCQVAGGGSQGTCAPLPTEGQPCVGTTGYVSASGCANGLVCNGTTCGAPTWAPLGAACGSGFFYPGADAGAAMALCSGGACLNGLCVAFAALGSACGGAAAPCGPGATCSNGKCISTTTSPATCN